MGILYCAEVVLVINEYSRESSLHADSEVELFERVDALEAKGVSVHMRYQYLYDTVKNSRILPTRTRKRTPTPPPVVEELKPQATTRARRPRIPTYV